MSSPLTLLESDDFIDETLARPLQIVYQDSHYVGVFKPSGLVVHRSQATPPNAPVLLQVLRDQLGQHVYPVHRLDQPTSGIILFALNPDAAAKFVELLTQRQVGKYYQALVAGWAPQSGSIDRPLHDRKSDQPRDRTSDRNAIDNNRDDNHDMQSASTRWSLLDHYVHLLDRASIDSGAKAQRLTLLEIQPLTGRWHQIRRHLAMLGHPVVGDLRHGCSVANQSIAQSSGVARMLLTAMRLDFRHPYTHELTSILVGRGSQFDLVLGSLQSITVDRDDVREYTFQRPE